MSNVAHRIESGPVLGENGTVLRVESGVFVVRTGTKELKTRRAVSCLVEPEPGDLVLVAIPSHGAGHILAVLERETNVGTRFVLDGNLDLQLPNGHFRVSAQSGVDIVAGERVAIASPAVEVHATEGSVLVEKLTVFGTYVQAEIERAKLLAGSIDSVVDRWVQRVKRSMRVIEETDHVRAGHIDHEAKGTLQLRGRNALLTSDELVKIDAEQVHIG